MRRQMSPLAAWPENAAAPIVAINRVRLRDRLPRQPLCRFAVLLIDRNGFGVGSGATQRSALRRAAVNYNPRSTP